jgi:hypothetical protein
MSSFLDAMPALYRPLLPSFFAREAPAETKATCRACAMCEGNCQGVVEPVDGRSRLFSPQTKCCTFHPRLPNYLLGALLADTSPAMEEGRRRIRARIESRVGTGPQWLRPPARFELLYASARRAFGRNLSLRCPLYEPVHGACTIWPYREAVCSTYFCKHVHGADGRKLWTEVKTYLTLAEIQLTRHALMELWPDYLLEGMDRIDPAAQPLTAEDLDERPLPAREHARLWGRWSGREEQLYRSAYEIVSSLSREQLERLLGLDGKIELAVLEKQMRACEPGALPARLKLNPEATIKWLGDGTVALGAYSESDALALPEAAWELLVRFTGKSPVSALRAELRAGRQADLDDAVLLALYRHRVLVEP